MIKKSKTRRLAMDNGESIHVWIGSNNKGAEYGYYLTISISNTQLGSFEAIKLFWDEQLAYDIFNNMTTDIALTIIKICSNEKYKDTEAGMQLFCSMN